jgi:hypothetical protein
MAAKIQMLKLLQEIRGFAELSNRRPPPRSPGLLLTQIRAHMPQNASPKRRLSIRIDPQDRTDVPYRVKINHVKQDPDPAALRPVP